MEVRIVGLMAGVGRVVAEDLILHHVLPRLNGAEEVTDVVGGIVVIPRCGESFHLTQRHQRGRVVPVPLVQILLLGRRRPAIQRVAFGTRVGVLRRHGERVAADRQRGLRAVEDRLIAGRIVVLVAAYVHPHARIIVERGHQVRKIAPVLIVE